MVHALLLRTALVASVANVALSFAPCVPNKRAATCLFSESGGAADDGGIEDFEKERMNIVRQLQRSYYRDTSEESINLSDEKSDSSSHSASASLDPVTGRIHNLPLWRVGWVETPGRRNCLNVHEMQYTHMFERILSQQSSSEDSTENHPLYFGHLYLPGGTSAAKSGEERYRLKTWHEELADESRFDDYESTSTQASPGMTNPTVDRSAVVGCLMQIIDHRRLEDGRLMILVQALERFVVEEVVSDSRPFSVANVQILLDKEELPWEREITPSRKETSEDLCKHLRGKAVEASFYYHDYEFGDHPKLPVQATNDMGDEKYLTNDDIPWIEISKLLPFAHYSTDDVCLDVANEKTARVHDSITSTLRSIDDDNGSSSSPNIALPLEQELWNGGILWDPPPVANVISRRAEECHNCDTLETLLWLALDDFCRATGFTLPEEIARLLPPEMDYLDITTDRQLSSKYPKLRRQRRLSYLAPALIENIESPSNKHMRQVWLNTPSTSARLLGALERYDYLNNRMMGQFE
mmetsp:Transcript_32805/g.69212  ORF Transcript_32805/g.69212 Transcript_32805/m.69212 type:complete len:525 (+) Transcript_32805:85-1659(+)